MIAILYNIRSKENVGGIFRTADALGISKLYLLGITPAPIDRFGRLDQKLAKVSLGAEKTVPWEYIKSEQELLLRLHDFDIIAVEQDSRAIPYYGFCPAQDEYGRIALVMGNEVEGLPASILEHAKTILEIPMKGKKESLNVAIAFGIIASALTYAHYQRNK